MVDEVAVDHVGVAPAADPVRPLDHDDLQAGRAQPTGAAQPGQPGARKKFQFSKR
ncbi:hypothetical protein [uncultured Nocardioides sp.]|uniref:hypothetical protein n=1 Tax=uncultured Nocardioides sp. TaxID=198441 RepID=UPI00261E7C3D|nr:hypothetical protein [uncultured Nocardioides sp.]